MEGSSLEQFNCESWNCSTSQHVRAFSHENRCWLIIFLRGAFMASGHSDAISEIDGCAMAQVAETHNSMHYLGLM